MTGPKVPGSRSVLSEDECATELTGADGSDTGSIEVDMKLLVIESYLKNPQHLTELLSLVLATTISWQSLQMQRVSQLLNHLAKSGLITDIVDPIAAQKAASKHWEDILVPIMKELKEHVRCLKIPTKEEHVGILFNDASLWLNQVLAYNKIQYPGSFDIKPIKSEVGAFFASG